MSLAITELLTLASNAGFSGPDLPIAVAVALAESGGNPADYNPEVKAGAEPRAGSYGLWQIYLTAHPQFNPQQLLADPQYNANAAFSVYSDAGNSFVPWTTYKYGQYLGYLDQVNAAIAAAAPPATNGTVDLSATGADNGSSSPVDASLVWPLLGVALVTVYLLLRG